MHASSCVRNRDARARASRTSHAVLHPCRCGPGMYVVFGPAAICVVFRGPGARRFHKWMKEPSPRANGTCSVHRLKVSLWCSVTPDFHKWMQELDMPYHTASSRRGHAGIDLVRMGDEAGLFWFELHSNVSNCNAWQISEPKNFDIGCDIGFNRPAGFKNLLLVPFL